MAQRDVAVVDVANDDHGVDVDRSVDADVVVDGMSRVAIQKDFKQMRIQ